MRNIWLLLKNYFICGVGSFRRKDTRKKTIIGINFLILSFFAFFAFFSWAMLSTAKEMAEFNMQACVLSLGLIISIFLAVIFALQKITGGKKSNDTELLLSMPFNKTEILVTKALSRICFNLLIVVMFFLPSVIAYLVYSPFNLVSLLGCITVMLLIPLFAVGLSNLVDYLSTVCFTNSKFGNISKAVFTLIVMLGVVIIYEFVIANIDSPNMIKAINWMITFNPVVMIPLISGVILLFIVGNWLNALLLNREGRTRKSKPNKISKKSISTFQAVLKNESNRYFNSPTLMLNTLLSPLFMIGITIWLIIDQGQSVSALLLAFLGVQPGNDALFISLLFACLTILTYPSAYSISLEGKQLWILRSMPIPTNTILNAKVLFNILLVTPCSLICSIIIKFALNLSIFNFIIITLIPILTNILVSYTGILVNLWFPKLEFESEASAIKQSMSSMIMMIGGMLITACLFVLSVWLIQLLPFIAVCLIIIGILLLAITTVATLTYTIGQRIFNRL